MIAFTVNDTWQDKRSSYFTICCVAGYMNYFLLGLFFSKVLPMSYFEENDFLIVYSSFYMVYE